MSNQILFEFGPRRQWLKKLALEALRVPVEIDLDIEQMLVHPVMRGKQTPAFLFPRYKVKSKAWLIQLIQTLNAMALHRSEYYRECDSIKASVNVKLEQLAKLFRANDVDLRRQVAQLLSATQQVPNVPD